MKAEETESALENTDRPSGGEPIAAIRCGI